MKLDYRLIHRAAELANPETNSIDVGQVNDGEFWACWLSPAGYPDWIYFKLDD